MNIPTGGGRYEQQCVRLQQDLRAEAVILFVVNGAFGTGFSVRASVEFANRLPQVLRNMANDIEQINRL